MKKSVPTWILLHIVGEGQIKTFKSFVCVLYVLKFNSKVYTQIYRLYMNTFQKHRDEASMFSNILPWVSVTVH